MQLKTINVLFLLPFICENVNAQNIFLKFYTNPLILNPANTGNFCGDYRIAGVVRNERNSVSSNDLRNSFYCDSRILSSKLPGNDRLAVGVIGLSEKDVFNGVKNSYFLLSGAYFKGLDEDGLQKLGIGFQANLSHKRIEPPRLIFPDQMMSWLNSGFLGIDPFQRKVIDIKFFDLNVGLNYQNLINDKSLLLIGLSVLHANKPYKVFDGGIYTIAPEACLQIDLERTIAKKNKLYCGFISSANITEKRIDDYALSCIYQMQINESKYKISAGAIYRSNKLYGDAIAGNIGISYDNFNLGLSYDINVFKTTAAPKTAYEITLAFIGKIILKK